MDQQIQNYINNYGAEYANALPTLGEAMTQVLRFFNIETIYGVGGDFAANLISAFEKDIELAPSSNEMHAGFSACGHAETTGIGAVLTTYTVGSLPCTSAAALAKAEKLPVVFISGCPGEIEVKGAALHHTVISSSNWTPDYDCALNAFKALGIQGIRLQGSRNPYQANIAAETFFQAIRNAYLNKEPVYIEVPRDLIQQKTQSLQLPSRLDSLVGNQFVLDGSEPIVNEIVRKLNQASCPLLFVGENIKLNHKLISLIETFTSHFNIPFITSWLAKGLFSEDNPLCLGAYNGVFSAPELQQFIEQKVDYILDIDSSIHQTDISSAFGTGTHLVVNFPNLTVLKGSVQQGKGLINAFSMLVESDIPRFNFEQQQYQSHQRAQVTSDETLSFKNIAASLNQIQSLHQQSFVYLPEVGTSFFASYGLSTQDSDIGRSWLSNPWYGAMGTSLPYARAVAKQIQKQNLSDIPVVITGDGGFHFQLNELIHFQRESLDIVIIYMRNDIFQLGKSSDASMYQCSTKHFEIDTLIAAYGGESTLCKTFADLTSAIDKAIKNGGIQLMEIHASTVPDKQCLETDLLNLFIRNNNGDPEAMQKWAEICGRG